MIAPTELRNIPLFKDLHEAELQQFLAKCDLQNFQQGAIVIDQDTHASDVYIILEGIVHVYRLTSEGKEIPIATYPPGIVIGDLAIFLESTRSASVRALSEGKMLRIAGADFFELLHRVNTLSINLLYIFAKRLQEQAQLREATMNEDLPARTLKTLILLAECFSVSALRITHDELSYLVGATRPRVSEALKHLENQGKIEQQAGSIRLCSLKN